MSCHRKRRVLAGPTAVAALVALTSCGSKSTGDMTYTVEVGGTKEALSRFTLAATGLDSDGKLYFKDNRYVRTFHASGEYARMNREWREIRVEQSGSHLALRPFVCSEIAGGASRVSEGGWAITETHEFLLNPQGQLKFNTNVDRQLSYRCEMTHGGDGDGASVKEFAPETCGSGNRISSVKLKRDGQEWASSACSSVAVSTPPVTEAGFGFELPDLSVDVIFQDCFDAEKATYPRVVDVGVRETSCRFSSNASIFAPSSGDMFVATPASGTVSFDGIDLSDPGRLRGHADVIFAATTPSSERIEFEVVGAFDLPLVQLARPAGGKQ
ncbi:hypothetical protein AKJ09_03529 [Labilithrix luteola]|uniref:Lipoprotein n=1 Tax=Labilithrix luteola TaxID=1391654 RepID=A0A0K1PTK7_9BACT|nr:hypothetical protein [Labilithrix luteola]AKU96865.1 hypothetical protein AKJ09_03529 [Labilithrix luteola]